MTLPAYEKLGAFYLGREWQADTKALGDEVLYDSRDLTTHAVCIGMTGSGKTGLCLSLLEEAALDGIPAIAIDPKGDIANLALTFPGLRPEDFRPWVDAGEAARKGQSMDEFAAATAEAWRKGLDEWGEDGARIQRLRDAASVTIYTPGSTSGRPLSILRSLSAPDAATTGDATALKERVGSAVAGLLGLLGIDADPMRSREFMLLSSLLDAAWRRNESLDLAALIQAVQKPPFDKVGVFDLESFYPARDRTELALRINGLLASPGFECWLQGDALDVQELLYDAAGKPRISIISIAHLNDAERMFVVTLVANELVAWMRRQPGTTSLRALFYMDEVFGFFPPTALPPSKPPLLTLMKQARAFGLGVVLATQNPVDLDYKGLGNAGTWFIGRLQTERDKQRVVEGLLSSNASNGLDKNQVEALLANLAQRTFLMRNVHDDGPVLLRTRWALSYLRGPMTLAEIGKLQATPSVADPVGARATAAQDVTLPPDRRQDRSAATHQPEPPAGSVAAYTPGGTTRRAARCPREIPAADTGRKRALRAAYRGSRARPFRRCQSSTRCVAVLVLPRTDRRGRSGLGRRGDFRARQARDRRRACAERVVRRRTGDPARVAQPQALRQGSGRAHLPYGGADDPALPEPEDHGGPGCFTQASSGPRSRRRCGKSGTRPSRRCAADLQRGLPRSRSGSVVPSRKFPGKKSRPATRPCRRR